MNVCVCVCGVDGWVVTGDLNMQWDCKCTYVGGIRVLCHVPNARITHSQRCDYPMNGNVPSAQLCFSVRGSVALQGECERETGWA